MTPKPPDFSVRYKWSEGALPPPYHYEYTIDLGPGDAGKIVFLPDYPSHDPPVWTETFDLDPKDLDRLHALMEEKGVYERKWTELENGSVGGSLEWMEATAGSGQFLVPSAIEEAAVVKDVYKALKALVPEGLWKSLMARREKFENSYS